MKKKILCFAGIAAVLLICAIYFRPLSLSDLAGESSEIRIIAINMGVQNGEVDNDILFNETASAEQKSAILDLLEDYPYRRTVGTLFSDGSLSELGEQVLHIAVYDGASLTGDMLIPSTSSGEIVVNDKTYRMENTEQLIEQIVAIME